MKTLLLALVILAVFLPASVAGEFRLAPPGELSIVVQDTDSRPLPGVTVTLARGAERKQVKVVITSTEGAQFHHLDAGDYYLTASLSGFLTQTTGPIPIVLDKPSPRLPAVLRLALTAGPYWIDTVASAKDRLHGD
jgi:hypothetical protein